ncbi:synaptotagmin [Carpediemonas membranifera]|uniref:Synaptotagmin n=1 Tax=Carpediemonas membranifera TaxID=201153 RepID=A0A8J6AUL3_9EUKA|nr:synaptotagmin [Carpediemonas membranifera]|eukprot:KAG9394573.1 synaptotagmin [Carpediemonas membranifera]
MVSAFLLVKVIQARNLPSTDSNNSSDPYCKLKIVGKDSQRTQTIERTVDPYWNESFAMKYKARDIVFAIFDADRFSADDPLGRVQFTTKFLEDMKEVPVSFWAPLTSPDGGFLHLSMCYSDSNDLSVLNRKSSVSPFKMEVEVVEASDLRASDLNGQSDPYALVTVDGGQKKKTKIRMHNLSPTWNEKYKLDVTPESIVRVEIRDFDRVSDDDVLGFTSFTPSELSPNCTANFWAKLQGHDARGFVHIKATVPESVQSCAPSTPVASATVFCPCGSIPAGTYSTLPTDGFHTDREMKMAAVKGAVAGGLAGFGVGMAAEHVRAKVMGH